MRVELEPPQTAERPQRSLATPLPAGRADGEAECQLNIKGDARDIQRFRRIAKRDGLRLIGLLRRAVEAYEREAKASD